MQGKVDYVGDHNALNLDRAMVINRGLWFVRLIVSNDDRRVIQFDKKSIVHENCSSNINVKMSTACEVSRWLRFFKKRIRRERYVHVAGKQLSRHR